MTGIISLGAYVPRMRLQRNAIAQANVWFNAALKGMAKGERAFANWDEDVVTMAVEAARDCLTGFDRARIAAVNLASTSAPFADRQNAGIVKEALVLNDAIATLDIGGSLKAGTGALLQALQASAGGAGNVLCVAAEKRKARVASEAEMSNGDGAAAFVVGNENPIATFIGAYSLSEDFVDHFRAEGVSFDYSWETRWVRDEGYAKIAGQAIRGALDRYAIKAADIAHFVVGIPGKAVAAGLAKKAGIAAEAVHDSLESGIGYTGAAHPLLLLAHSLEKAEPGEKILVLGFGQGCDVLLFAVTPAIRDLPARRIVSGWDARSKQESNYLKFLAFSGLLELDTGMRAEFDQKQPLTALFRNRKAVLGLIGARDPKTGAVQFPRTEIPVDSRDGKPAALEDYPLADRTARILTFTADSLAYTPDPPNFYGMIEFDGGGRMLAEFTDADADAIAVGAPMRMMFRIKAVDDRRHYYRYFWKAVRA